jgi:hypothetical protein
VPLQRLHRQVAVLALGVLRRHGFALAGGNALIAHGVIDRPTSDVDLFTDREAVMGTAVPAVEAALRGAGFEAEKVDTTAGLREMFDTSQGFEGLDEGIAEWVITAPGGEQTELQIAYFERSLRPVTMRGIGPVLALEDVIATKVSALATRGYPRDFLDLAAILGAGYTVDQVIGFALRLDPGLEAEDFTAAGERLDGFSDQELIRFGVPAQMVPLLRERFADWPRGQVPAGRVKRWSALAGR